MGAKAAVANLGSLPAHEREDDDRSARLASVAQAIDALHILDCALGCVDDAELGRLASDARAGERAFEEWARQVEAFRASKQLFESGVLPDLPEPARRIPDEVVARRAPVVARRTPVYDGSRTLRFFWEALAFMVGFVLSLLVT